MVLSVLVIILSFAIPSVGKATARAELKAATEQVEHAVWMARNLARASESPVHLNIIDSTDDGAQYLNLSVADGRRPSGWQDYAVPGSIVVAADHESFVFNAQGLVENPGRLLLAAPAYENIKTEVKLR